MTGLGSGYDVTFSEGFKRGLEALPKGAYPIVDRALRWLSVDPFAKNTNAKPMKNAARTFRMKIGAHVRMLYRVRSNVRRVEVFGIGTRQHCYQHEPAGARTLSLNEAASLRAELAGIPQSKAEPLRPAADLQIVIEETRWITPEELFLLHIPDGEWASILEAGSMSRLLEASIDATTKLLIEDYWTHPAPTQVERLYALGPDQDADAIVQQPLSRFLIALDPEQQIALKRIKTGGPYLLKGSAGTGKSLTGLYHIRELVIAHATDTQAGSAHRRYGVITYTNALVDANREILRNILPTDLHAAISCSTLDKFSYDLCARASDKTPNALDTEGIANWLQRFVLPALAHDVVEVLNRLGVAYAAAEIEEVIFGNMLTSMDEYLAFERRGRKRRLLRGERTAVWSAYTAFLRLCEERDVQTFAQWRITALQYLQRNPDHPRFDALFVDEAQDLSKVARQLCLELVRDPRHLLLASDTGQSIYTVPPNWRQSDPRFDFRGRSIPLQKSYRCTRQVGDAIRSLRMDMGDDDDSCGAASPVFSGPKPRWIETPIALHADVVCSEIERYIGGSNPTNAGQIAVIVRDRSQAARVKAALKKKRIGAVVICKEVPLRIDGAEVNIITAHSSKGLGFPIVFVPFVHAASYPWRPSMEKANDADQISQIEDSEQRLLYVALSRASHQLCIIVDGVEPSRFVSKLDRDNHWG